MESFTHWDYAEVFSGRDAAHLIGGFDPSATAIETEYRIRPIVARMKKSYYMFIRNFADELTQGAGFAVGENSEIFADVNPAKNREAEGDELWNVEVESLVVAYNQKYAAADFPDDFEFSFSDKVNLAVEEIARRIDLRSSRYFTPEYEEWKAKREEIGSELFSWSCAYIHEFDDQRFSRSELHRWLTQNNLPTKYRFAEYAIPGSLQKPLSSTERNSLLVVIAALCKKTGLDPAGPKAASEIVRAIDGLGSSLGDDTVRTILKKIPDALGARSKK